MTLPLLKLIVNGIHVFVLVFVPYVKCSVIDCMHCTRDFFCMCCVCDLFDCYYCYYQLSYVSVATTTPTVIMQSTMNFELINDFNAHEIEKMCPPAENRWICACFMFIDEREFNQMTSIPFPHLIYLTCSVVSTAHVFFFWMKHFARNFNVILHVAILVR